MTACMIFKTVSLGLSRRHTRPGQHAKGCPPGCVPCWPGPGMTCGHAPPHTDLEWRLTYVGSAESEKYDQVLDMVYVGPVAPGQYRFVFQVRARTGMGWQGRMGRDRSSSLAPVASLPVSRAATQRCTTATVGSPPPPPRQADPPDFSRIPPGDVVGVTVILLTCSYRNQVRGGWVFLWAGRRAPAELGPAGSPSEQDGLVAASAPPRRLLLPFLQEFIRIGYYVNTEYEDELMREEPPETPQLDKCAGRCLPERRARGLALLGGVMPPSSPRPAPRVRPLPRAHTPLPTPRRLVRSILADKPRVTKFPIEWDDAKSKSGGEGMDVEDVDMEASMDAV